uniref:BTB domain-containing protein n=1 Tax=Rhabditophanes sp. KR3021 TaxID=114890 RepID=A0AC35TWQ7_9BILA
MGLTGEDILKLILAVLLPPLAVLLHSGCDIQLLINIVLCCLGYIPGMIHALWWIFFANKDNIDPYAIYLSAEALEKNISMELEVVSEAISYNTPVFAKERKGMIGLLSRLSVNLKNDYFELSVVSDSKNVDVIYQLQLKVRSFDENGVVCRQFQHYCDQGTRLFPYACFIGEEMKLKRLKVDVEIVHKNIDRLLCFEEGDLHLSFGNGVVLKTYKSVIGSHLGYFKDLIGEEINSPVTINMNDFSVDAMKELLYQV